MAVARMAPGGAAVTIADAQVEKYRRAGWLIDGAAPKEPEAPEGSPNGGEGNGGADGKPAGNAGRDAWADYARTLGIDVPEDAKREDIKALVDDHDGQTPPE